MRCKSIFLSLVVVGFFLFFFGNISAYSNESIQAKAILEQAEQATQEMQARGIPVNRANESLQEAKLIYYSQFELEKLFKKYDYSLVVEHSQEVLDIKEMAFKIDDELKIFLSTYNSISEETNLSGMQGEYDAVLISFEGERFEDVEDLIDAAYEKLSEVQSRQTTLNIFYETTSKTLKNFFKENWIKLFGGLIVIVTLFFIFSTGILRLRTKFKILALVNRKKNLEELIKQSQKKYFKEGDISEREYEIRIQKFSEMIRDINRQIPLLRENLSKLKLREKKINPGKKEPVRREKKQKKIKSRPIKNSRKVLKKLGHRGKKKGTPVAKNKKKLKRKLRKKK